MRIWFNKFIVVNIGKLKMTKPGPESNTCKKVMKFVSEANLCYSWSSLLCTLIILKW